MADRNALIRKSSNSYSCSEASDAGSSSSKWDQDEPSPHPSPVVRLACPARSSLLPPSSALAGSGPQPALPGATAIRQALPKSTPPLEIHGDVLVVNSIYYDNSNIRYLLANHPDIRSVLVRPEYVLASMVDLLDQFTEISTVTTMKFDFELTALAGRCFSFRFDGQCGKALSSLLANNTVLTELDFSRQEICIDILEEIAIGLNQQTTLQVLDLTGDMRRPRDLNLYSPDFMGKMGGGIAAIIGANAGLSSILASYQSMDDEDAMLIAGGLRTNTRLKTLDLAENNVGDKGCAAIFNAIRKNKHSALIKLDLSGCRIDTGAAKSIAKCLKTNATLIDISIGMVPDAASLKIILDGLSKNKTLIALQFVGIEDRDQKYSAVCHQLSVELQSRAARAAAQPVLRTNYSSRTGKEFS